MIRKSMLKTVSERKLGKQKSTEKLKQNKTKQRNTAWPRKQNILFSWSKGNVTQRMEKECFCWWVRGDEKRDNDSLLVGEMKSR